MIKKSLQTIVALCLTGFSLNAQCPVADAGPDQSVCSGASIIMAATLPPSVTGTWTKVGVNFIFPERFSSTTDPAATITGLTTAANVSYIWTVSDGASCNLKDTVLISVQAPPTSTNAGTSKTICVGGTATMSATAAGNGSVGTWTILNGTNAANIVITDINNRQTAMAGFFLSGTDTLRWTVSNALCGGSVHADVVIKTNSIPDVAQAGSDIFACKGDTVQLIGNTPGVGMGSPSWSLPTGSGAAFYPTNGANNDTVKVRGGTASGKVNIVYKITSGSTATATVLNGCLSTDTVVVSFGTSKPNAGTDIKLCKTGAGTVTLAATAPATGETGNWTFVKKAGSEVITDATSYTTTVTNITSDTLTLRWTLTSGACSAYDDMSVVVLGAAPTHAVAGSDITRCAGDTITLHGSIATLGNPSWTRAASGNFLTDILAPTYIPFIPTNGNNDTIKVALVTAGTYKLYYTISVGTSTIGSCISKDSLQIFVNAVPRARAGASQTSCTGASTFTVNGTGAWVGTGKWTITGSRPGSLVEKDSSAVVTGLTSGNTILAYTVSNGVCSAISTTTISIGIPSVAAAGSDMTACVGDTVNLVGNAANSGSPRWSSAGGGPTIIGNANNDSASATSSKGFFGLGATAAGTYNLVYSISIGTNATGACVSRDTVKLTLKTCVTPTVTPTGIEENNNTNLSVTVLPNPASGSFNLTLKDSKISYAELTVLTLDGRTVILEQLGAVKDIQKVVNISNLSNGIYFVRVKKGDSIYTNKLVVQ
jgi:Secretion system C-terminal sorting domain